MLVVKNLPVNPGDLKDAVSIPGSGRSPGGGYGNPLQCFLPGKIPWTEEPGTGVHRVTKSQTLSDLACMEKLYNQLQTMDLISNKYSVKFSTRCDNCQIFESQNNHSILRSIYSYNFTRLQVSFQKSFCL